MQISKVGTKTGVQMPFPQLRGSLAGLRYPALAEIKYDGEFNYLHYDRATVPYLINKYGTKRTDFPMLDDIRDALDKTVSDTGDTVKSATLVCEAYWGKGKLGALYDLLSHKADDALQLRIFDIVEVNGCNLTTDQLVTRKELIHNIGVGNFLGICWVVEDKDDVDARFKQTVDLGYEGIVVKDLHSKFINGPCSWVKVKYKDRNDLKVVTVDLTKERIEVEMPNASILVTIVGVKAPFRYKKHIKAGDTVTIEHQGVLPSGSLRHPVLIARKEWK